MSKTRQELDKQLDKAKYDLYYALKDLTTCFRNIEILSNVADEFEKHSLETAVDEMTKVLAGIK